MMKRIGCAPIAAMLNDITIRILEYCKHTPQLAVKIDETVSDGDEAYFRGIIKDALNMGIHVGGSPDTADGILYLGRSWSEYDHLDKDVDGVARDGDMSVVKAISIMIHNCLPENASLQGRSALVIGRGPVGVKIVGNLLAEDMTVTVAHSKTPPEVLDTYYGVVDLLINAGATGLSLNDEYNPGLIIDVSGGNNTYDGLEEILLVDKIGILTRACLLNSLVIEAARKDGFIYGNERT